MSEFNKAFVLGGLVGLLVGTFFYDFGVSQGRKTERKEIVRYMNSKIDAESYHLSTEFYRAKIAGETNVPIADLQKGILTLGQIQYDLKNMPEELR